jgi:zinc protease
VSQGAARDARERRTGAGGTRTALAVHDGVVRAVLPNGLTVLARRDGAAPVVGIVTHVKAGYFDEPDALVGIAHVLEHMYFKGTPTRGVGAIARDTKRAGGWLNAHTIYDHTAYVTALPSAAFEQALDIQFDAFAHSSIDAGELARELEVIVQEARRKRDAPGAVTVESLFGLLHDRHRIRRWRIGDPETLRGFTRADVAAFHRRWYVPSNTIVAVVGALDPDEMIAAVAARHGTLPPAPVTRDRGPNETVAPGVRVRALAGDIAQAHAAFGWRTVPGTHPDAAALDLAGIVLGSGRAARLYRAVREARLASGVSAYQYSTDGLGVFVVHAELPVETWADALRATWREVAALRTDGPTPAELERAQRVLEARWLRRLETMDGQAAYLAAWEAEGDVALGAACYERLMTADSRAVRDAVRQHLAPDQVSLLAYRPASAPPWPMQAGGLTAWLEQPCGVPRPAPVGRDLPEPVGRDIPAPVAGPALHLHPVPELVAHGVEVFRTARGVPVLVRSRPGTPLVNAGVFLRGGAVAEPIGSDGLARLMAHGMLQGTERRDAAQLALDAERLGGSVGVSAGLEGLGWSLSVPVRQSPAAMSLLAEVVLAPVFPAEGLAVERALALAEVDRQRDDMQRFPMRLAIEAAYPGHPYARSVLGTAESLSALTVEDVRAQHARTLQEGSAVVAVVGDVSPREVAARVGAAFAALESGRDLPVAPPPWTRAPLVASATREKQQTALAMLFRGPARRDPERHASRLLGAVCSGLGGRFFEQLRDRQSLAYTVAAYPVERCAGGLFVAYIATSPEREEEAREGLLAQFARLREATIGDDELARARAYLIGAHALAQQAGASVLAELVDAWSLGDGLAELAEHDARLHAVTAADIRALAERWFDPRERVEGVVRGRS